MKVERFPSGAVRLDLTPEELHRWPCGCVLAPAIDELRELTLCLTHALRAADPQHSGCATLSQRLQAARTVGGGRSTWSSP